MDLDWVRRIPTRSDGQIVDQLGEVSVTLDQPDPQIDLTAPASHLCSPCLAFLVHSQFFVTFQNTAAKPFSGVEIFVVQASQPGKSEACSWSVP
jgi:hypothetical protein